MLHLAEIGEIKARAEAINLKLKPLAKAAGIHSATVYRSARGDGDNRGRTLRKLNEALQREELRIAQALLDLPHVQRALADRLGADRSEAA